MRTWLLLFLIFASVGIVTGCKSSGTGTTGPSPVPTQSARGGADEVAFGDDFTVGIGTSFCGISFSSPCSTSPSGAGVSAAANPTGWAQRFSGSLSSPRYAPAASIILGVSGALTGDAPNTEGFGGDILTNAGQFADLKTLTTTIRSNNIRMIVIVQSGINDVFDAYYSALCVTNGGAVTGGGNATQSAPCTASGTQLADGGGNVRNGTLYKAYSTMLTNMNALVGGAPEATLIVGVPDVGSLPYSVANFSASARSTLTADSQLANQAMQAAIADAAQNKIVAYVDWYNYFASNPQYYTTTYYASDLLHLNDQGYSV
ncbi:MAG: GDSL-type esterase/lipase family protein, partial [Vulcanimicrobiaceae bacterium]